MIILGKLMKLLREQSGFRHVAAMQGVTVHYRWTPAMHCHLLNVQIANLTGTCSLL